MWGDLTNRKLIYFKGFLFLFAGLLAAGGVIFEQPTLTTAFLLVVAIWCFCRFYYFAFYVIERYVDPSFRFAGLVSVVRHLLRTRRM